MAKKKKVEETPEPEVMEPSFLTEDEFEIEWGEPESKKESNQTLPTPILRQAKVVLILKHKNEIIIELLSDNTGERIQYNPDIHSQLKEGDLIDVP
jgi:hypothetical protein